ncbi:family 20 glycosylhydrolase [Ferrimonas pelagia]|uniref:beta-N-acetylhexosaminidase n=1 Tax=Ferrimonas pelagia TaxID=1177826 RepID=A0ABP9EC92_9GAMM
MSRVMWCLGLLGLTGVLMGCQPTSEQPLVPLAQQLDVRYQVLDNRPDPQCDPAKGDGACYRAQITLTAGESPLPASGWEIRFSQISFVQSAEGPLQIEHLNGDLHRLYPTAAFAGLAPGEQISVPFRANFWSVSNWDAIPNYILMMEGAEPAVIASTREARDPETGLWDLPFVEPLTDPERQLKRTAQDHTPLATAQRLYQVNHALGAQPSAARGVVPTPRTLTFLDEAPVHLARGWHLLSNEFSAMTAPWQRLALLGFDADAHGVPIHLSRESGLAAEGYRLTVGAEAIRIVASTQTGAFYGLQTLAGLIRLDEPTLPAVQIVDEPRYDYRGMHIDIARNYSGEAALYTLLDQMAAYKLNKLHLHMADDEGWRLAIPGLPELTELGAQRCADDSEQRCLLPQLGAGTDPTSAVNGYLSREEYIALLQYAAKRHIEVIPSLDMPGHSRAAVAAMGLRQRRLLAQGKTEQADQYRLHDVEDAPQYLSVQYYTDNTINPCLDSSYAFIGKVLDEVKAMHDAAGVPLRMYHIGADETEHAWDHSPRCEALIASELDLDSTEALTGYFIRRVVQLLNERGIRAAGWSDGMLKAAAQLDIPVTSYSWDLLAWGGHAKAHQQMRLGWDVVLSSPDALYFDFPYEADPDEGGYYWGSRNTNSYKVFSLQPDNLPVHAEIWRDRQGNGYQAKDTLPRLLAHGLRGIQGQLWTETTRHADVIEYKLFPRLLALAERAWHRADWELAYRPGRDFGPDTRHFQQQAQRDADWRRFAALLGQQELAKLDRSGVAYRIPTPGAQIAQGQLHTNAIFPGLPLEYRIGDGAWQRWQQPVSVDGSVEVRARSVDEARPGRSLRVQPLELSSQRAALDKPTHGER